jgi:predicted transcriptional regulator
MYTEYLHTREVTQLQALLQDAAELIEDLSTEINRLKDLARYYFNRLQQHGLMVATIDQR